MEVHRTGAIRSANSSRKRFKRHSVRWQQGTIDKKGNCAEKNRRVVMFFCALASFLNFNGYYAILGMVLELGVETRMVTIPIRIIVLCCSLFFLFSFGIDWKGARGKAIKLLITFWVIYGLRLVYDSQTLVAGDVGDIRPIELPLFGFGVCLIPLLGFVAVMPYRKLRMAILAGYIAGSLGFCISTFFIHQDLLIGQVGRTLGAEEQGVVSSIALGYCGASTVLVCYALFATTHLKSRWPLLVVGSCGAVPMLLSGNRGSILALIVGVASFAVAPVFSKKKVKAALIVVIGGMLLAALTQLSDWYGSLGLERIRALIAGGWESTGRSELWGKAVDQFIESPIFGGESLVLGYGYAHNVFLDVLMSTGLVGFGFFLSVLWIGFGNVFRQISVLGPNSWMCSCFLGAFVASCLSFGAYFHTEFWCFLAMVCVIPDLVQDKRSQY
jgi:uncharacterized membrane protein YeaQ/YmgE (transglycosylase-associated protein family)